MLDYYERRIKEHHTKWEKAIDKTNDKEVNIEMGHYEDYTKLYKIMKEILTPPTPL